MATRTKLVPVNTPEGKELADKYHGQPDASTEGELEMSVDLFRANVKPSSVAVQVHRIGEKYDITRGKAKGTQGKFSRDIAKLLPVSKIMESNPKLTKAQAQAQQDAAGKDLLKQAAHYVTEAQQDAAVVCNRITHSMTDCNINLHKVSVQDEAMKLHVSTGRPLDECKAFISGKAVKAAS